VNTLPELPYGIYSFENIRKNKIVYVDKTQYIPQLEKLKRVFFTRPRRFGKSLTISTLEAFFLGNKELFEGLSAEKYFSHQNYTTLPVIHLDMSEISGERDVLHIRMHTMLQSVADMYDIQLHAHDPASDFKILIEKICRLTGKQVVILIDEYDAPVTKALENNDIEQLKYTRTLMYDFYLRIKSAEKHIHFALVTGISKYNKMGMFSASLNHLVDISLASEFSALTGFTHQELISNFKPFIHKRAENFGISYQVMLHDMQQFYNGFSFDGITKVYNPFSTMLFLGETHPGFQDFWIKSGSESYIRNFLKNTNININECKNKEMSRTLVDSPAELEELKRSNPELVLYQAGYLTLRYKDPQRFLLDYPNQEVLTSLSRLFLEGHKFDVEKMNDIQEQFRNAFMLKSPEHMVAALDRFLAGIPYHAYTNAEKKNLGEPFYQSLLFAFLSLSGFYTEVEVPNNLGRRDLIAHPLGNFTETLVIEIKAAVDAVQAMKKVEVAIGQMREKSYGNTYAKPTLLAIAFNEQERKIGKAFLCEHVAPTMQPLM